MTFNRRTRKSASSEDSSFTIQQGALMVTFFVALALTLQAAQPAWWTATGGPLNSNPANDYAVANQGQLKQFTQKAVLYMDTNLPGGAGTTLDTMVAGWSNYYATNGYSSTNPAPQDFKAVNLGQLKYVASLVDGQLVSAGYTGLYPSWIVPNTNTDYVAANIGQLKTVFNFDLSVASNAVTGLTASNTIPGEIDLSWTLPAMNNATSIIVQQSTDGGTTWADVATLDPTATSASITGLTGLGGFVYRVITSSVIGATPSTQTSSITPLPPIPATPASLTGTLDVSGNMNLTWQASTGATSYSIDRETVGTGTWVSGYATTSSGTTTTSTDTAANRSYNSLGYRYRVSAINVSGTSTASNEYPLSRYAVIDLGTNFTDPVKVTQSGYILGAPSFESTDVCVWHNGVVTTLQSLDSSTYGWFVADIEEDGTVIGSEAVTRTGTATTVNLAGSNTTSYSYTAQDLAEWAPGSSTPVLLDGTLVSITSVSEGGGEPTTTLTTTQQTDNIGVGATVSGTILFTNQTIFDPVNLNSNDDLFKNSTELGTGLVGGVGTLANLIQHNTDGDLTGFYNFFSSLGLNPNPGYFFNGTPLDFYPLAVSNRMTIGGTTKTYVVGQNLGSSQVTWWDGTDHNDLINFLGSVGGLSINAAVATVSGTGGSSTQQPAVQIVATSGLSLSFEELWEMNPATGTFGAPQSIPDLLPDSSGWMLTSGYSQGFSLISHANGYAPVLNCVITDSGAIVGTATYTGTATTTGSHGVLLLPVQINAYRPQMVPSSVDLTPTDPTKLIIPQSEIQSSGVHIRVNVDNDVDANGNFTNLVKVTFSSPAIAAMSNVHVAVQSGGSNLWVYSDAQASSSIAIGGSQGNLTLDANGNATIWVEARAQGGNDLTFLLTSGTTTIGTLGKLHFVNYDSFVEAFSGETFGTPGAASSGSNQGVFNVAQNLYLEGYNVAYYDVHTISSSTSQPAFGEISDQISSGFVTSVGIFGYSHGGGETYNTCNLLAGTTATISFVGYIDAIQFAPPNPTIDTSSQTTYPPGAAFMWNYYETNDTFLHSGPVTGANLNLNVNTTAWGTNLYHSTRSGHTGIAASPNVQANLQSAIESHVSKY